MTLEFLCNALKENANSHQYQKLIICQATQQQLSPLSCYASY